MFEALLLVSFVNLLSMLPLFAAFRLAEHMGEAAPASLWEQIISYPPLLCLGVVVSSFFLARRLSFATQANQETFTFISVNAIIMAVVWVIPGLIRMSHEIQRALIDSWSVAAGILLLLASFQIPLRAMIKLMIGSPPSKPES